MTTLLVRTLLALFDLLATTKLRNKRHEGFREVARAFGYETESAFSEIPLAVVIIFVLSIPGSSQISFPSWCHHKSNSCSHHGIQTYGLDRFLKPIRDEKRFTRPILFIFGARCFLCTERRFLELKKEFLYSFTSNWCTSNSTLGSSHSKTGICTILLLDA